jgi:hypothetical protein
LSRLEFAGLLAVSLLSLVACSADETAELPAKRGATGEASVPDSTARSSSTPAIAAGTAILATIQDSISSRSNSAGDHVRAIVSRNVLDDRGHIAIPGGAEITLTVARLRAAKDLAMSDGAVALEATALTLGTATYAPTASVGAVPHMLKGRGDTPAIHDVVVTPGTPITITLTQALKIAVH